MSSRKSSSNGTGCFGFLIYIGILCYLIEKSLPFIIILFIIIFAVFLYFMIKKVKRKKKSSLQYDYSPSKHSPINNSQRLPKTSIHTENVSSESLKRDSYFESAGKLIIEKKWASISFIQLNFNISHDRAVQIISQLYHAGVIGPETGNDSREILMTKDEFEKYLREFPMIDLRKLPLKSTNNIGIDASGSSWHSIEAKKRLQIELSDEYDPYFIDAAYFVLEKDKASIGMLQRLFKIGFNRAARIMDQLYDADIVGPEEGASPRKVLMTVDEFEKYLKDIASNRELEKEVQTINSNVQKNNVDKSNIFSAIGITCDYSHSGKNLSFLCNILVIHVAPGYSKIFINNLLQENSAEDLSIILCDLSMSGFEIYNGIPNLFIPVVNTIDKTYGALGWLYEEMKYRTTLLLEHRARNIDIYNQYADKKLNKLVYIIDEIFYLQNNSKKFESLIPLLLNCNRMGLYVIFFSKFDLKNLDLGKVKDLITVYDEQIPFAITSYLEQSGRDHKTNYDLMNGIEFEVFCKSVLQANGFKNLRTTKGSGDQGIDLLAEKEGIKYGIQCKCYSSDIGNKAVQEAFAGKTYYGCHVAVVLTNRNFTRSAKDLAESNQVLLWGRDTLNALCENYYKKAQLKNE